MEPFYAYKTKQKYAESEGVNSESTWLLKCEAYGKRPSDTSPYLISNEWISARLAQFLGLPIPPFALIRRKTKRTAMFASYSFNGGKWDTKKRSANPSQLYRAFPLECAGVVVFDILIGNFDRNPTNIKVDNPASPSRMYMIDHERALFHLYPHDGAKRLRGIKKRLGVADGSQSNSEWHCLLPLLESIDDISHWVFRVGDIPPWFINDICKEVKNFITAKERRVAIKFLTERRDTIGELILSHKHRFTNIKSDWPIIL